VFQQPASSRWPSRLPVSSNPAASFGGRLREPWARVEFGGGSKLVRSIGCKGARPKIGSLQQQVRRWKMAQPVVHFEVIGNDPHRSSATTTRACSDGSSRRPRRSPERSRNRGATGFGPRYVGRWDRHPGWRRGRTGLQEPRRLLRWSPERRGALQRAESLGGIRVMGPATSPNGLVVGHFTDPEGTLIGVAGVT